MDAAHRRAAVRAPHPGRGPAPATDAALPRPAAVRRAPRPRRRRRADAALVVIAVLATIAGIAYLASDRSSDRSGRSTPPAVGAGASTGSEPSLAGTDATDPLAQPPPDTPVERPVLGVGAAGPPVVELQERLATLGFDPGRVDGRYGDGTGAAVRAFQASVGLTVDGVVGADTWAALDTAGATPSGP